MAERHHSFRRPHETEDTDEVTGHGPDAQADEDGAVSEPPIAEVIPEHELVPEAPPTPMTPPSAHALPDTASLALIQAFTAMCGAMRTYLEDNEVLAGHCDEIQGWMANSGGDVHSTNAVIAFRHMVKILEEVLGHSMTLP